VEPAALAAAVRTDAAAALALYATDPSDSAPAPNHG